MAIESNGIEGTDTSVISRYTRFKDNELTRLKKLKLIGLKSALNRKLKENGARFPVSGLLDTLCLLVFECNVQFLSTRYMISYIITVIINTFTLLFFVLQTRSDCRCR